MKTGQIPKIRVFITSKVISKTVYTFILLRYKTINPILEKLVGCIPNQFHTQSHISSSDAKGCSQMSLFNSNPSISPYETINLSNNKKGEETMSVSWKCIFFQWHMLLVESLVQFHYTGTWHAVFSVNNRHATMDFLSSCSISSQKSHYTSLFFLTCLHYWYWTNTLTSNLISSTIN